MKLTPVTEINQIKEGDLIVISDGNKLIQAKAKIVKTSDADGVEVIYRVKANKFFNLGMYLDGKSWVKDVRVLSA